MRIVHLITSLEIGGAQEILRILVQGLQMRGYEQQVVYFYDGPYRTLLTDLGITCIQVCGWRCAYDPGAWYALYQIIQRIKPDYIHGVLWLAGVYARLLGRMCDIKACTGLHNDLRMNGSVRRLIDYVTTQSQDRLIAAGDHVYSSAQSYFNVAFSSICLIRNGVDWQQFFIRQQHGLRSRKDLLLDETHIVFGAVGRLDPVKQYPVILQAFKRVVQTHAAVRLVILGGSSRPDYLIRLLREYAIDPSFLRIIMHADAAGYYPLFDCLVHACSIETMPLAVLGAMASKIPCVVTSYNAPDHGAIINNIHGIVVPDGDIKKLTDALLLLSYDDALRKRYGNAGLERAQKFDAETMIVKYVQFFESF